MLKTIYEVVIKHYDYFDHFRSNTRDPEPERFDSLLDAFKFYKAEKAKDYSWPGDHSRFTHRPVKKIIFVCDGGKKHGYVRGYMKRYTSDKEFIERKYLNKPWVKKHYKPDESWLNFYSQPAFTPDLVLCHKIQQQPSKSTPVIDHTRDWFDDPDDDLPF